MIRISKKGDYAVFIMGHLAQHGPFCADPAEGSVISAQELADRSGIAKSVVANLMKDLTRAGLLTSTRGIHGGYRLARPAEEISLAQILRVVEGPFVLVACAHDLAIAEPGVDQSGDSHPPPGAVAEQRQGLAEQHQCDLVSFCPSKNPMRVLHSRIAKLMDDLTLPELIGEAGAFDAAATLGLPAAANSQFD